MAALALALWISIRCAVDGAAAVLLLGAMLWSQLYAMGLFAERRGNAMRIGLLRLLVLLPGLLLVALGRPDWLPSANDYLLPVAFYVLFSVALLGRMSLKITKKIT